MDPLEVLYLFACGLFALLAALALPRHVGAAVGCGVAALAFGAVFVAI